MCRMNDFGFFQRLRFAGKIITRGVAAVDDMPAEIMPPSRTAAYDPLQLSTVFRGVQVLQTAIAGLPLHEMRGGVKLNTLTSIIDRPDANRSRRDFISDIVASLCLDGNAFVRKLRYDGEVVSCQVLPPSLVTVRDDGRDPAAPVLRYSYLGREYTPDEITHLKFLNVPGRLRGLGPISAAREEVEGAKMARDYKARFYTDSSNVKGYLKSDQKITPDSAKQAKDDWGKAGKAGDIKVVGSNLTYVPLDMKPADLQFLETQKFDTTQIARLLGIPASIMLAAVDGSNLTYSNIEQSWIEFADYTLAAYTGEIEELLSSLLPRGRVVRFDWDSSRRADMADRYNAYKTAIGSGWLTVDDVRDREGLPPLTPEQAAQIQQIGGLGVITVGAAFALLSGRKISLKQRSTMQEATAAPQMGGIVRLTGFILRITALFELVGAALLLPTFCADYGLRGIWYALFHSISAFCNAGFDLLGTEGAKFVSLTQYADNPLLTTVIAALIVFGGLGFLTWEDICTYRLDFHRYTTNSAHLYCTQDCQFQLQFYG